MEYGLKGKTVLITGGARGLGRAVAEVFAREGARLALGYHTDRAAADAACAEITERYGATAVAIGGNIASEDDVQKMFGEVAAALGETDILINNCGVCPVSRVAEMSFDEWKEVIDINLGGVFLASREMVRHCTRESRGGCIVNVASQSAFNGSARGKSHYAASKGGVVSFTVSLAKEVASLGIRVNAVCPGMMPTRMTANVLDAEMEKYNAAIPIGRIAQPEEIAQIIAFLASERSGYMTGSVVDASGGMVGR